MSDTINARNIQTLAEHTKELLAKQQQLSDKIVHLETIVAQQNAKIQQMDQYLTVLRIRFMGSGPTA
jgi:phage shock protein A